MALPTPQARRAASGALLEAFHEIRVAMDCHTSHWAFGYTERSKCKRALEAAEDNIRLARRALEEQ